MHIFNFLQFFLFIKKEQLLYFINCVNHVWDPLKQSHERNLVSKVRKINKFDAIQNG